MWDVETGKCKHLLGDHSYGVAVLAYSDNIVITGSQDKMVNIWDNGVKVNSFLAHEGRANHLSV